jgi:hypothetical protein
MKKKRSKLGVTSIALAAVPLILYGVFCLVAVLEDTEKMPEAWEVLADGLWIFMWYPILFCPIIGVIVAVVGLFQRTKFRLLPAIGAVINSLWIIWMAWFIYCVVRGFEMDIGLGGL